MNKRIGIVLLMSLTACSPSKLDLKKQPYDGKNPLNASKDEIVSQLQQKGLLEGVQTSALNGLYEVVISKNDTQYFVKDGKVVSMIRPPVGQEEKLIFWRYSFQGKLYRDQEMPATGHLGHRIPGRQLACDTCENSRGVGVIYDPSSERVKRVFYYDQE